MNAGWLAKDFPEQSTQSYAAPPLRGVWATAPYFHNGSVPTLEGVVNSSRRPKIFRVLGTERENYDTVAVGLKVESFDSAPANLPRADVARIYDTTRAGMTNTGHLFGDALSEAERRDLLEFLKSY